MREDLKIPRTKGREAQRIHIYADPETVRWLNEQAIKNKTSRSVEVKRLVDAARQTKADSAPAARRRAVV